MVLSSIEATPATTTPPPIGVLISGRGSNLQAIIAAIDEGRLHARIAVVLSNRADAAGLARAAAAGLVTDVVDHKAFPSRTDFEEALARRLRAAGVSLVCLAGFMRILSPVFLEYFPGQVLNVHPSLLPAFPGMDAQRQAWAHGVKVAGATVHMVTPVLDAGPIVLQAAVPVLEGDSEDSLAARILVEEHRLYPLAIAIVLDQRWRLEGRRLVLPPT